MTEPTGYLFTTHKDKVKLCAKVYIRCYLLEVFTTPYISIELKIKLKKFMLNYIAYRDIHHTR